MKTATVVATIVGLLAPLPPALLCRHLARTANDRIPHLVAAVIAGFAAVISFCAWTLPVLAYYWDWFYLALRATPVKL